MCKATECDDQVDCMADNYGSFASIPFVFLLITFPATMNSPAPV